MGELLFCDHPITAMPCYIESMAVNVYSLEELCYCIKKDPFLLEDLFASGELTDWIRSELLMTEFADKIEDVLRFSGIADAAARILEEVYYCTQEEKMTIIHAIREVEHKSVFERGKMRADRMLQNGKYVYAIAEYRKLLGMKEECSRDSVLCGNIWHDIGTAYARLYLFHEAEEAYRKAFALNQNRVSLEAMLSALWYQGKTEAVQQVAAAYGVSEEKKKGLLRQWESSPEKKIYESPEEIGQTIAEWRQEYLRSCR